MQTHVLPWFPQTAGNSLQNKSAEGQWVFEPERMPSFSFYCDTLWCTQSNTGKLKQRQMQLQLSNISHSKQEVLIQVLNVIRLLIFCINAHWNLMYVDTTTRSNPWWHAQFAASVCWPEHVKNTCCLTFIWLCYSAFCINFHFAFKVSVLSSS